MIRWLAFLLLALIAELLGLLLAPLLPAFRVQRCGWSDNHAYQVTAQRLPRGLSWFDTPDNDLMGDSAHCRRHATSSSYWTMVCWLARNRTYGFKWGPLAAPMDAAAQQVTGNRSINRNNGQFGTLRITMGAYWQWKCVKPIGQTGYCWMLNFGWLLDDASQPRALFMFSPRFSSVRKKGLTQ